MSTASDTTSCIGRRIEASFRKDFDSSATELEPDCLEPPTRFTNILRSVPETRPRDIGIFPINNMIEIVNVEPMKDGNWKVLNYN